jgi:hypothetical protein
MVPTLEDAVAAIGSFVVKLGKLIVNAVEAIGILLHLDEIKKTRIAIREEINRRAEQLADAITKQAIPQRNTFFENTEDAIAGFLGTLKVKVITGQTVSDRKGQGSTAHSVYTVQPKDGGAPRGRGGARPPRRLRRGPVHEKSPSGRGARRGRGDP